MRDNYLGVVMRSIRRSRNENLASLSKKYHTSIAELSAIEVGRAPIPSDYIEKINLIYYLTSIELKSLEDAVLKMKEVGGFERNNTSEMVFARKINSINQKSIDRLRQQIEGDA